MDADAIRRLQTLEGDDLLIRASRLPPDRLTRITRLRKICDAALAEAVVAQLELRLRGQARFKHADRMLFTPQGLEQATGDALAAARAVRFVPGVAILDACCGIGADAMHLAAIGPVVAVDSDAAPLACTQHNARILETSFAVHPLHADVRTLDLPRLRRHGIGAAFFDPSRRKAAPDGSARRTRRGAAYSPPLEWFNDLCSHIPLTCAKVSPAIDDSELDTIDCGVEFVSTKRECREAVMWSSEFCSLRNLPRRFATVVDANGIHSMASIGAALPKIGSVQEWIFEPDPAIVRAGAIAELAGALSAERVDAGAGYIARQTLVNTPFAAAYRVLEEVPLRPEAIVRACRSRGLRVSAVKTRWTNIEPEPLERKLRSILREGEDAVVIAIPRGERLVALLCLPARRVPETASRIIEGSVA